MQGDKEQSRIPTRSKSYPVQTPETPRTKSSPMASSPSISNPFLLPMLSLNPGLSPMSGPMSPRSPLASAAAAALSLPPTIFPSPSSPSTTPRSAPPPPEHKTNLQRVARATREFRDVWIVPE